MYMCAFVFVIHSVHTACTGAMFACSVFNGECIGGGNLHMYQRPREKNHDWLCDHTRPTWWPGIEPRAQQWNAVLYQLKLLDSQELSTCLSPGCVMFSEAKNILHLCFKLDCRSCWQHDWNYWALATVLRNPAYLATGSCYIIEMFLEWHW